MILTRFTMTAAALCLALGVAACAQSSPQSAGAIEQPAAASRITKEPAKSAPLAAPKLLPVAGPYRHEGTGLIYPTENGGFIRTNVVQYDVGANDVSANYEVDLGAGYLVATVYVYPWTDRNRSLVTGADQANACAPSFEDVKQATFLGLQMKGAKIGNILEDGPVASPFSEAKGAHRMVFEMTQKDSAYGSEVYLYCGVRGAWVVKYRFTYPAGAPVAGAIATFQQQVPAL